MRAKARFLTFCTLLTGISSPAGITAADRFLSGVDGRWSSTATWVGGMVPTAADDVIVTSNRIVTVDVTTAVARSIDLNIGTLRFSTTTSSMLTISGGDVYVTNGSTWQMGTPAAPIPAGVTAVLRLSLPSGGRREMVVENASSFAAHGAPKKSWALGPVLIPAGALSFQAPDAQVQGWNVGDTIVIAPSEDFLVPPASWVDQSELRVVTGLSSLGGVTTVSWTGVLAYAHSSAAGVRAANLTRNVVVRSAGSNPASDTAYFSALGNGVSVSIANAEFTMLGEEEWGGATITDAATAISGSSFHHNGYGLRLQSTDDAAVSDSLFVKNRTTGLTLAESERISVTDGMMMGNGDSGVVTAFGGNDYILSGNHSCANALRGFYLGIDRIVVQGNKLFSNGFGGIDNTGDNAAFLDNIIVGNDRFGLGMDGSGSMISGNRMDLNAGVGIGFGASSGTEMVSNLVRQNDYIGVGAAPSVTFLSAKMVIASNAEHGVEVVGNSHFTFVESLIGYEADGSPAPNQNQQYALYGANNNEHLTFRGTRVHPLSYSDAGGGNNCSVLSYNQNFATGTVVLSGARTLSSGQSFTLDHAQPTWASSATAPRSVRGVGHAAAVPSTDDASAVTQMISVRCVNGAANQWVVEGSEGGLMHGPFTGGLSGQNVAGQFTLNFTPGGARYTGDRLVFLLLASSRDAGVEKRFRFVNTDDGDAPQLTVAAGASFTLRGAALAPLFMEKTGAGFYAFLSAGDLTLQNAQVEDMNRLGLQLSGAGAVQLSSVTFDNSQTGGAKRAYITATGLTSNTTFHNLVFDPGAADPAQPFSVDVQGADAGLRWFMTGFSGNRSGDLRDNDPNQRVLWADTAAPDAPSGFGAFSGFNTGDVRLAWTAAADRETDGSTSTLKGGAFRIFRSTAQAERDGALASQAQTVISTTALPGAAQGRTDGTLALGTAYYYRLWAADEFGNASAAVDAGTVPARVKPFAPPNFSAAQAGADISLSWAAPVNPPPAYRGVYLLEYSTTSAGGPWSAPLSIAASSTAYLHTGLLQETTYYYQLYATDSGGGAAGTSLPAVAQVRTQDVSAPQVVPSVGARAVGVAWSQAPVLTFSKVMNPAAVAGAVSLRRLVDNLGQPVPATSQAVAVDVSSHPAGAVFTVIPLASLERNNVYELTVATTATDAGGKAMDAASSLRFVTLMDHTSRNVVTEGAGGAVIDVPPMALPADGFMAGGPAPAGPAAAATLKAAGNARDPYRVLISSALVDLTSHDAFGAPQSSFASYVTVSLPYPDANGDGLVDVAGAPVLAKTLKVHWLDETHNLWVPLPSTVDAANRRVSAQTSHFTTFALLSQADLDLTAAFAFPSPFRPGAGDTDITFSGVGQAAVVTIMTVDGEVVWEGASSPAALGQIVWDVRNADGSPAATGVYLYRVTNASSSKTGKLAVIR